MSAPSTEVGPGFLAFAAFFFLAVALWLLMRSMVTRMRRITLQERSALAERERAQRIEYGDGESDLEQDSAHEASGVSDGPEEGQRGRDEV